MHMTHTPILQYIFREMIMVEFESALEFLFRKRTRNIRTPGHTTGSDPRMCLDIFSHFLFITNNIPSIRFNFSRKYPNIFFKHKNRFLGLLTAKFPYFFYPNLWSKAECCVYALNDISCSRTYDSDSSKFLTIWQNFFYSKGGRSEARKSNKKKKPDMLPLFKKSPETS